MKNSPKQGPAGADDDRFREPVVPSALGDADDDGDEGAEVWRQSYENGSSRKTDSQQEKRSSGSHILLKIVSENEAKSVAGNHWLRLSPSAALLRGQVWSSLGIRCQQQQLVD